MKPILKYRGGKSKEIFNFIDYIPKDYKTYYEPFLGGGAVFFYLEPREAVIGDINKPLIKFYQELQTNYQNLRADFDDIQEKYKKQQAIYEIEKAKNPTVRVINQNEEWYYRVRDMFNHKIEPQYSDAVLYYFINKTSYSGMIRYNANGEYNVPFGRYKNLNTDNITEAHWELLKRSEIYLSDYEKLFDMASVNDFMFLDPPYDSIFNDYGNLDNPDGFNEQEHRRLAENYKKLKCKALMIIGKTPLTQELYGEYIRGEYFKSYAVNIRNRFKSESKHLIITNY